MDKESRADRKRMTFGILSMLGAAILLCGSILYMVSGADGLGSIVISATFILTFLAVIIVLIGLINRLIGRKRPLTKRRFICGYGFFTYGALAAGVFALASVIADLGWHYEAGIFLFAQCVMCIGGWMSFVFGFPIIRSFHGRDDHRSSAG